MLKLTMSNEQQYTLYRCTSDNRNKLTLKKLYLYITLIMIIIHVYGLHVHRNYNSLRGKYMCKEIRISI